MLFTTRVHSNVLRGSKVSVDKSCSMSPWMLCVVTTLHKGWAGIWPTGPVGIKRATPAPPDVGCCEYMAPVIQLGLYPS